MFANAFQSGFISVFYSIGSNPLSLWDKSVKNGHIRRVVDDEVKSLVLELSGTNVATTYITCPIKAKASLGIKLPFLVMVVKNMKKYFTFEIQIADDKDMKRRFRVSNFQSTTKVRPFCTTMPIGLSPGWNQIQFNLADFTKRAYGSTYLETVRVQVHANVRIRRIYFSDRLYGDDEMPQEFKLFLPVPGKKTEEASKDKQERKPSEELPGKAPAPPEIPEEELALAPPPATPIEVEEPEATPGPTTEEETQQEVTETVGDIPTEELPTADEMPTEEAITEESAVPPADELEGATEEGEESDATHAEITEAPTEEPVSTEETAPAEDVPEE